MSKGSDKGFTLVEVLVAVALIGISISALMGGLGSLTNSYRRSIERDQLVRLANEKLDELIATGEWQTVSEGEFEGDRYRDFAWSLETQTTTVDGLEFARLTVTRTTRGRTVSEVAESLVYRTTTTTVPLDNGGGQQ